MNSLKIARRNYVAFLCPTTLSGGARRERQARSVGSLLAAALPAVTVGFAATLIAGSVWAIVLGPLLLALLLCTRLNRAGRSRAAGWLLPAALSLAGLGTNFGQLPSGPTPLLFAIGAVFLSGFLAGRWAPFAFAAFGAAFELTHLHLMIHLQGADLAPDGGPPMAWRPAIAAAALTIVALVSSLIAGNLEDIRTRSDELTQMNAALADANARLEAMATADPLTGLPNHRGLVAALDAELERARRYGRSCVLLFLDIDHFKALNDGYGHAAGDVILQEFARRVRGSLRSVDLLGRWGGEEFVILLPELNSAVAADAAERVRACVAEHVFPTAGGLRLTCSIGMAAYPSDATARGALLDAADRAMYAAKHLGRNQARSAADPAVAALLMGQGGSGSREDAALLGTVAALASLVAARDRYTEEHSQDVALLAARLASAVGLDAAEARMVGLAGRLHDIGKVGVPDAVLHKAGRLSGDEWESIRRHPLVGAEVVGHAPTLRALAPLIRSHHERWDGRGYPDGLSEEHIPLGARVLAVADAYLAMTSDRPYRAAQEHAWSLEQIERLAGTQFDPRVAAALRAVLRAGVPAEVPFSDDMKDRNHCVLAPVM